MESFRFLVRLTLDSANVAGVLCQHASDNHGGKAKWGGRLVLTQAASTLKAPLPTHRCRIKPHPQ